MQAIKPRITYAGFTMIELLIVVAVVGILCALALPVYRNITANSKAAACQANLRKIGLGMTSYASEHNNWMPPHLETFVQSNGARIYPKWYAWIAPYITSWDGQNPAQTPMDKVFFCPANPKPYDSSVTYYSGMGKSDFSYGYNSRFLTSKKDTTFVNQLPMRRTSVPEPSKLVLVTDIPNDNGSGMRMESGMRQLSKDWVHPDSRTIATWHSEGSNLLFLDGHVEHRRGSDILGENYSAGNWSPYTQ